MAISGVHFMCSYWGLYSIGNVDVLPILNDEQSVRVKIYSPTYAGFFRLI